MDILYSATTKLAYHINQTYYGGRHYVWCAPAPSPDSHALPAPASSDPWDICRNFAREAAADDRPGGYISNNRLGILRGAGARESQGIINAKTRKEIEDIVENARNPKFAPLFLVIPFSRVRRTATRVSASGAAAATSEEYVIENLRRGHFDVWE